MSKGANGVPAPFEIILSGAVRTELERLAEQAAEEGRGPAFAWGIASALKRLRRDARAFGEARFNLYQMKLLVRVGVVRPAVVLYGVHTERPLVFVRRFHLLST